eukprot:GEMP01041760.1.p1 GENE.GEMP01041760.1~~GEMP01041760.1.p1  ORF type:complete len:299 (+),score=51.21 GEMP01041760.1:37-933(+)
MAISLALHFVGVIFVFFAHLPRMSLAMQTQYFRLRGQKSDEKTHTLSPFLNFTLSKTDVNASASLSTMALERHFQECPDSLVQLLKEPVPEDVFVRLRHNFRDVPCNGEAMLLVGPAGAGKTRWLHQTQPPCAVIDGDVFRSQHLGWQKATSDPSVGYTSAFEYVKEPIKEAKTRMLDEAIVVRRNVCLPITFSTKRNWEDIQRVVDANYKIHVVGLFIDFDTMQQRTRQRAIERGRLQVPSKDKWNLCMNGLLESLERFPDSTTGSHNRVFDSTTEALELLYAGPQDFESFKRKCSS